MSSRVFICHIEPIDGSLHTTLSNCQIVYNDEVWENEKKSVSRSFMRRWWTVPWGMPSVEKSSGLSSYLSLTVLWYIKKPCLPREKYRHTFERNLLANGIDSQVWWKMKGSPPKLDWPVKCPEQKSTSILWRWSTRVGSFVDGILRMELLLSGHATLPGCRNDLCENKRCLSSTIDPIMKWVEIMSIIRRPMYDFDAMKRLIRCIRAVFDYKQMES